MGNVVRFALIGAMVLAGLGLAGCAGRRAQPEPKRLEIRALRRAELRNRAEVPLQPQVDERQRLEPVYFDYDKRAIRPDQRAVLAGHAERLKAEPGLRVVLEGHCDERGSLEYNNTLGRKRAESVRAFLVKAGVAADRLSVVSFGKERPAVTGTGAATQARNRRVEFVVSGP